MLDPRERDRVAREFGVAPRQVERDWAVAHVLSAIAEHASLKATFIGGTALSSTFLPTGRLSEDIDLWAQAPRGDVHDALVGPVARALRRELGEVEFVGDFARSSPAEATGLWVPGGDFIQVQVLPEDHYPPWPTEWRLLDRRYSDVPDTRLRVPTAPAAFAWKTVAWLDRGAARDLWDLWALAQLPTVDATASALFRKNGQSSRGVPAGAFDNPPSEQEWQSRLGHQTRLTVTAAEAADVVKRRWSELSTSR